jgi:hypothetical protein
MTPSRALVLVLIVVAIALGALEAWKSSRAIPAKLEQHAAMILERT